MRGGHPVLEEEHDGGARYAAITENMLRRLRNAAHCAGFNVAAPAVQVALIECYTSACRDSMVTQVLELGDKVLDELRQMRRRTDY